MNRPPINANALDANLPNADPIFASYVRLMDTLVAQFGNNCQVSLYDMRAGAATLVAVAGAVMDVAIGSRLPPALLTKLTEAGSGRQGKSIFTSSTPDGRRLSSSLTAIDDPATGRPAGCLKVDLCIENLINSIDVLQTFCNFGDILPAERPAGEDIGKLVDTIIADAIRDRRNPRAVTGGAADKLSGKAQRMEIVRKLDERGVFLVKGSVDIVASKINISKYTLYSYLDQIKKSGGTASFR